MTGFWNKALLGVALIAPIAVAPLALKAEDIRVYHDRMHNDDHHWNGQEDRAYRVWAHDNHRRYRDFWRLRDSDQQAYWGWRHEHSDAVLNIQVR